MNRVVQAHSKWLLEARTTSLVAPRIRRVAIIAFLLTALPVLARDSGPSPDLTIVHLTDLHLSSRSEGTGETPWTHRFSIGGYKLHKKVLGRTPELLQQAVDAINRVIRPDVVVITGDIVDRSGDADAWDLAVAGINRIEAPVITVRGDHDSGGKGRVYRKHFGATTGEVRIEGYQFTRLGFRPDAQEIAELEGALRRPVEASPRIFCLHRMLIAPELMLQLKKLYTGGGILSPRREQILPVLNAVDEPVLVLCGHSHTNYEGREKNLHVLCTSSLAEYPHELRVVEIRDGEVTSRVMPLSLFVRNDES